MINAWNNFFKFINSILNACNDTASILEIGARTAKAQAVMYEQSLAIDNAKELEAKL